jgi:hypothetical protein
LAITSGFTADWLLEALQRDHGSQADISHPNIVLAALASLFAVFTIGAPDDLKFRPTKSGSETA